MLLIAAAIAVALFLNWPAGEDAVQEARRDAAAPAASQDTTKAPGADSRDSALLQPPADPPTFDVVRVEPDGSAVIAGRAAPGSEITLNSGEKEIGKAKADQSGEWVLVPAQPLSPGSANLSVAARTPDGKVVNSEKVVVVVVPE
ncbi:MAG: hypothetical protein ACREF6_21555, partial [Alphaproteobacteria bacterium]